MVVDQADLLAGFAHAFPGWLTRAGAPLSWAHYLVGSRFLGRKDARDALRAYSSARAVQAVKEDQREWVEGQTIHAGWKGRIRGGHPRS